MDDQGPLKIGDAVCYTWIDPQKPLHDQPIGVTGVVVEVRPDPCMRSLDLLHVRRNDTGELFGYVAFEVTRVDQIGCLIRSLSQLKYGSDTR